ncbi:hypothetical protein GDO81_002761 [Engystomops pustulosus]|uniref:Uncharacterized protein n=1 Tax=Engystomops pustulosus TaxID=76066 RepID=A0AAV7DMS9_ENGPU|nr:hypothetical protein GDO81_002761 [Engystomops pustulosus]
MGVCVLAKFRVSFLRIPVSCHFHLQPAAMSKMKLPDRWTDYIPVGKRIPGTRFIAFKVPLTRRYDHRLAPWQRFSPMDLIKEVEEQNEELGLVVDLTCTKRYYSPWVNPFNSCCYFLNIPLVTGPTWGLWKFLANYFKLLYWAKLVYQYLCNLKG